MQTEPNGDVHAEADRSVAASSAELRIADHQLLRRIGRGSYGEVWLARTVLGLYRAVKIVYRDAFQEPRPFERELEGIRNYEPVSRSHEGLVDVLQIGQSEGAGMFYYVMELADDVEYGQEINPETYKAQTLKEKLDRQRRLPLTECLELGRGLSQALHHLHGRGLVHRDIKPANIIFVNGTPKLADIGLVSGIDETCSWVGTQGYMAPEGPGQPPADVYSLGKVLYECCTGEDRSKYPHLPSELEACPERQQFQEFNEVILRACHQDVEKRYRSAEELGADLTLVLNGQSVRRLRLLERRWARFKRVGASLGVVMLVLGLLLYSYLHDQSVRTEQRQREVGTHLANGLNALEAGQHLQTLPSLVEALRLDHPARADKHRLRLGMTLEQCPKVLQMWLESGQLIDGQFSPDGRLAVLAGQQSKVQVKDLQTGDVVGVPFSPTYKMDRACFSPDGRQALTTCQNGRAELWDWQTGNLVLMLPHPNSVMGAKFSSLGDQIATACADNKAYVWDAKTGKLLFHLAGHSEGVLDVAFSHDGTKLVTAGRDQVALLWDARTGAFLNRRFPHESWVYAAAFSPDDRRLATTCFNNTAHVWDVASEQEVFSPLLHADAVVSVVYSPDGRLILTGCWDSTARLWDAATGRSAAPYPVLPHPSRVRRAAFHRDGHRLLTVCQDGSARLWDLAAASMTPTIIHGQTSFNGTQYFLASNQWVDIYETQTSRRVRRIELPGPVKEVTLNRSGEFLLTLCQSSKVPSNDPQLGVRQVSTGARVFALAPFSNALAQTALSDAGQRLVVWSSNHAQVYDLSAGTSQPVPLLHSNNVSAACFSPAGRELATLCGEEVYVWELPEGRLKHRLPWTNQLCFINFSPDGRLLVAGSANDTLNPCAAQVWNVATGQPLGPLLAHQDGVRYGAFSPDGRRVATASEDFTACLWDLQKPERSKTLRHPHQVFEASFSPDGSSVLTTCRDRTARLWDAETGEPLTPALRHDMRVTHGTFLAPECLLSANQNTIYLWPLKSAAFPLEDLLNLVWVLTGKPLSPTSAKPQPAALQAAWQGLKTKYPEQFQTTDKEVVAWHRQQGQLARETRQWSAALFHLNSLREWFPDDSEIRRLREVALGEIHKQTKPNPPVEGTMDSKPQ